MFINDDNTLITDEQNEKVRKNNIEKKEEAQLQLTITS
jgi:hypothetical protein